MRIIMAVCIVLLLSTASVTLSTSMFGLKPYTTYTTNFFTMLHLKPTKAIPEPAAMLLIGAGLVGLAAIIRNKLSK